MLICVTGENDFGRSREVESLIASFIEEYGDFGLERIDGDAADYSNIHGALTSLPFLASKKLVILKNPSGNKEFNENFKELLEGIPDSVNLVIVEPKLDKRTSLYKYLKKASDFREFRVLEVGKLAGWLVNEAKSRGGQLTTGDAGYLVSVAGSDQQKLSNELDKLLTFNKKISRDNIDNLVVATPQSKIFDLLDSAFAGNKRRTLALYEEQRSLGEEPEKIIAMLAWQLHILALVKTAKEKPSRDIAKDAKINPFVAQKSSDLARRLSFEQVKDLTRDLLQLDKKLKTSKLSADEALQNYFLAIG